MDPYFVPIISIKNRVPHPDSQTLCVNERVWEQYFSLSVSSSKISTSAEKTRSRLGLSLNEGSNTWIPIPRAHFQGDE